MAGILGGNDTVGVLIKTSADNTGIDKTNAGLGTVDDVAKKSASNATQSFDKFNRSLGTTSETVARLGGSMTTYISGPLAAVAVGSLKMAGDFQQSLNILQSVSGATAQQMSALRAEAKDLGNDISLPGISAKDAAQGMTELAKAGLGVNDVMAASKGVLSLAKAGQIDVSTAAMTTARALNAFQLSGDNANKIADLLAASANASTASVNDMALGLQMAGAQSHSMGVSLQDTVTALAMFSNAGINGSDAGTSLKQMFLQLANPTDKASGLMKQLGLDFFDAKGNFVGLANTAQQLNEKMSKLTQEQRNQALATIFGSDATRVASILAQGGAAAFDQMSTSVNKAGAATELAAAQNAGFNGALDNLKSTAETTMIEIGTTLLPIVTQELKKASDEVAKLTDWFNQLSPGQKAFLLKAAEIAIVTGPATLALGKMGKTVSDLGSLFSLASKGIGLFTGGARVAAAATGAAGLAGEAGMATTALAGGGGLLAALGPVALALGAIAVVGGGTYLAVKHFHDIGQQDADMLKNQLSPETKKYRDLAEDLGVTLKGTASGSTLLDIANTNVKNSQDMAKAATERHDQATKNLKDSQAIAKQKADELATAQNGVRDAHDKFGINSPQYQAAVDNLKQKQNDYNWALADTVTKDLDLTVKTGQYKDALGILNGAVSDASGLQKYFNDQLHGGVGVIATFGPTALAQVNGVAQLQNSIAGVISSWNTAVVNIQTQSPNINAILFGTSSTIQKIQGQSDAVNNTLSAAKSSAIKLQGATGSLQGSSGGLQGGHATGTNYFTGGATMVGEDGPELAFLPAGTQIKTAPQTRSIMNGGGQGGGTTNNQNVTNHQSVSIGTVVNNNGEASRDFWAELDQDNLLASRGFTTSRGFVK